MSFIQLESISKTYKGSSAKALDSLSLELKDSQCHAFLGPSGCGKTTLLRIIAGLETPDEGTLTVNGELLSNEYTHKAPGKRGIGMVFQNYALFPHMTVEKNILFGIENSNKKRLNEMLDLTGLTGLNKRYPHELSGGQQQRVALARALAPSPSVLLLDEPFSNLDNHLKKDVRAALKDILRKSSICSVLVTHSAEDAEDMASNIVLLNHGKLEAQGTLKEMKEINSPLVQKIFE